MVEKNGRDEKEGTEGVDMKTLYTFAKNSQEEVRVSVGRFKGRDILNIRVYYETDDGRKCPSKKGLAMSLSLVSKLKAGIDMALAEWEKLPGESRGDNDGQSKRPN